MRKKVLGILLLAWVASMIFACGIGRGEGAYAEKVYCVTFEDKIYVPVKGGTTETRKVYVSSYLYNDQNGGDLIKITYDKVVLPYVDMDVSVQNGEVKTANVVLEEDDVTVYPVDLVANEETNNADKAYYFTVESDHCCAFVFSVYYTAGDEDAVCYDSEMLKIKNIDSSCPTFSVEYGLQSGTFCIDLEMNDLVYSCATSGLAGYEVYRTDLSGENHTLYYSKSLSGSRQEDSFEAEQGEYKYYLIVRDAVGNACVEKLIATFEYDELADSYTAAKNTMRNGTWSQTLINRLEEAYSYYLVIKNNINKTATQEEKDTARKNLQDALAFYNEVVAKRVNGDMGYTVQAINDEYFETPASFLNVEKALAFVPYGDDMTVSVSVAKFSYVEKKYGEALTQSGLSKADDVYVLTVLSSMTGVADCRERFSAPLQMQFSVGDYLEISAVQITDEGMTVCSVKEFNDGRVVVYLPYSYGKVEVFVRVDRVELRYLYFLFLLVPVGGGLACIFVLRKKKKEIKNG